MKRQVKHPMDSLWFVISKASKPRSKSSGGGFTLIESLVAIIIVSITVVAISPPIFWATGTRVQNRRAEQALSIAQATIDQVRAKVERGGSNALELPAIDTTATAGKRPNPPAPAPSAEWTSMQGITPCPKSVSRLRPAVAATETTAAVPADQQYPAVGQYLPVMTTTDCDKPDFLVQVFRNDGICADGLACSASAVPVNERRPLAFSVGVRVYSALAKNSTTLLTEKASLTGTTGTGQVGTRPLAVLYATVAKSDDSASLNNYRALCRAGGTSCE
ncbi:MAG: prepilin-type N-terminal cleavage/methylation domain-containing protein [Cyanobacteria bacterium]|nr:prepilin-type N-terminal cleavage/methylation domain-containing protein [Cyanobacteriota bacterium]